MDRETDKTISISRQFYTFHSLTRTDDTSVSLFEKDFKWSSIVVWRRGDGTSVKDYTRYFEPTSSMNRCGTSTLLITAVTITIMCPTAGE